MVESPIRGKTIKPKNGSDFRLEKKTNEDDVNVDWK